MKVGPDYEKPETKMPDSWYEAVTYGLNDGLQIFRPGGRFLKTRYF